MAEPRIFVTHQSPLIDENGVQHYVSEVSIDRLEVYGAKLLLLIARGVSTVKKLIDGELGIAVCRDRKGIEFAICVLEKLGDAISIALRRYFVVPLTPLPKIEEVRMTVPTPQDVLYAWLLGRGAEPLDNVFRKSIREGIDYEDLRNAVNLTLQTFGKEILTPPRSESEALERLELLMNLPSDTRPGCSLSKLVPHLLTTTGLAVAKYIARHGDRLSEPKHRLELALLRLAALLHDIGKPYAWVHAYRTKQFVSHARESASCLERVGIYRLLRDLGLEDLYHVLKLLVEKHHEIEELSPMCRIPSLGTEIELSKLGEILSEADRDSSNIDRLSKLFAQEVRELLESYAQRYRLSVEDLFLGVGPSVWRAWLDMPSDVVRKVAEKIVEKFRARIVPPEMLDDEGEYVAGVKLSVFDVAGIQSFIKRESLRILSSASFVVDLCTVYAIPRALMEVLGVALDSIVYAGGGFVIAFVPSNVGEKDLEKVVARAREIVGFDLAINYALVDLERSWPRSIRKAIAKLAARKNLFRGSITIELGYEVLCEYCGRKPATNAPSLDVREYVCDECRDLHRLGTSMYVVTKLRLLESYGYNYPRKILGEGDREEVRKRLSKLYEFLMPWLSGVEIERVEREQFKIAIVKADGNAAGQYMSSAINVTEAMCRSIRIDMGMKLGFVTALAKLRNVVENEEEFEELATRIFVGTLYAGGDDMLAIWPAFVAIPVALSIAKTFWRINGGELQLSIAIAAAKPKHNVWNLLDAVEYMLSMCKKRFREILASTLGPNLVAVLSVVKSEWQLFEAEVEQLFRKYAAQGRRMSYQPLFLAVRPLSLEKEGVQLEACSDIATLLIECFGEVLEKKLGRQPDALDIAFELYRSPRLAKKLVEAIHEAMNVAASEGANKAVLALYLARAATRGEDLVLRIVRKGLARLGILCSELPPLFDLYHIAEVFEKR